MEQELFDWVEGLLADALASKDISDWERSFLQDQAERVEKYGASTRFSDKQWKILDRVAEKISIAERPGS